MIAVTLVNNTQTPISDLDSILTRKKRFKKPKVTTEILLASENTPWLTQREDGIEANVMNL